MGVDILVTSGGKHVFGPPGTGFLCGRKGFSRSVPTSGWSCIRNWSTRERLEKNK